VCTAFEVSPQISGVQVLSQEDPVAVVLRLVHLYYPEGPAGLYGLYHPGLEPRLDGLVLWDRPQERLDVYLSDARVPQFQRIVQPVPARTRTWVGRVRIVCPQELLYLVRRYVLLLCHSYVRS